MVWSVDGMSLDATPVPAGGLLVLAFPDTLLHGEIVIEDLVACLSLVRPSLLVRPTNSSPSKAPVAPALLSINDWNSVPPLLTTHTSFFAIKRLNLIRSDVIKLMPVTSRLLMNGSAVLNSMNHRVVARMVLPHAVFLWKLKGCRPGGTSQWL